MELLRIIILSAVSLLVLFILTKIVGYRQISQLSFFDYVIGISVGSIAAEMATNTDLEWWKGVAAMTVYCLADFSFSVISQKSITARRLMTGTPIVLIEKGKINKESLKKARLEMNDLLTQARTQGYFNLADIDYAIMETTGGISFMPVALKRPLNPKDFNFAPTGEGLSVNVIIDGKIMEEDLQYAKVTKKELEKMLKDRRKKAKDLILATIDSNKQLTLYEK